ncbi:peptidoglycan editing factor PgeF [Aquabacterium sp. NJ1]|uniref:peptidoglycan editing factor PgeF n=1 Tax=Aquabacterium sp. NJ1 TaxID=1538295 RepID=UPI00069092B3|nr:peptidoglycan editing factor PgeF [Aquabacterium sp. NJ1]
MTSHTLPPGWLDIDLGKALHGRVGALMSARAGGVSVGPYAQCNLGDHVQDDPQAVLHNRSLFAQALQAQPVWMTQVHGNRVIWLTRDADFLGPSGQLAQPEADGALTTEPGLACTVMVADCLPVLLAAPEGRGVAALHAGWRGLAGAGDMQGQGIVHTGVRALCEAASCEPSDLQAWLGPCIGPAHFEVGADVLAGFGLDPLAAQAHRRFTPRITVDAVGVHEAPFQARKWLADLPGLARDTLNHLGVSQVGGGTWCTVSEASRFFSFRRDRVTGRQAASIWLR